MTIKKMPALPVRKDKCRAFLKWAGGKYHLIEAIEQLLPEADVLVEPFAGAGSVFLNTDFERYIVNDINQDLIDLYRLLQQKPDVLIAESQRLFVPENNQRDAYYALRQEFNETHKDKLRRACLFLYLNRHGYNGLCRYNKKGGFNVPFGSYKRPYFPQKELEAFATKAHRATFTCVSFEQAMLQAPQGAVVYCDPPYAPLSATAAFTSYHGNGFTEVEQRQLAQCAEQVAQQRGVPVLISNHDLPSTREWYQASELNQLQVRRTISRNGKGRCRVDELLALFQPKQ